MDNQLIGATSTPENAPITPPIDDANGARIAPVASPMADPSPIGATRRMIAFAIDSAQLE